MAKKIISCFNSEKGCIVILQYFNHVFFKNYFNFKNRATRREFWWSGLALLIIGMIYFCIVIIFAPEYLVQSRFALNIFTIPFYAVTVRRLHDTGRSGWWVLLSLVPLIGAIVLLVYMLEKSEQGENQFGPEAVYDFESASRQKGRLIQ